MLSASVLGALGGVALLPVVGCTTGAVSPQGKPRALIRPFDATLVLNLSSVTITSNSGRADFIEVFAKDCVHQQACDVLSRSVRVSHYSGTPEEAESVLELVCQLRIRNNAIPMIREFIELVVDFEVRSADGDALLSGTATAKEPLAMWTVTQRSLEDALSAVTRIVFSDVVDRIMADRRVELYVNDARRRPAMEPPLQVRTTSRGIGQRWAVVVGISDYKHSGTGITDLRYAARDAAAFRDFLLSEAGGGFDASRVALLTNEQATTREINKALNDFLKQTIAEDLVVIFFSGHGAPDPDKPDNLYLLTYDTDPDAIAGTAFPMWNLEAALKRNIEAERVVVFADACHSSGFGGDVGQRAVGRTPGNPINDYFRKLAETKPGRVIFTSSEGYEVSHESAKWGGGHGVFTWALLEGLHGKADGCDGQPEDGIVSLGEITDYVYEIVRRETMSKQHPVKLGSRFDRNLPLGVVPSSTVD